jgi:tRNA G10  N-methylase Trm11
MNNYVFILGRKPLLSEAELEQYFNSTSPQDPIHFHKVETSNEVLIGGLSKPLSYPQKTLDFLGGTIKIGTIFSQLPLSTHVSNIANEVSQFLIDQNKENKKIVFGISTHNINDQHNNFLKNILIGVKKNIRIKNPVRFINKNFQNLKSAAIKGENLLTTGYEILIIKGANHIYLANTIAIQDFESYSHRDYSRPARDPRLGMLPPKLAQIMINLAGINHNDANTLYDPFCGIGTILSEGLLMGYNVAGSDIEQINIEKTAKNLSWLEQQYKISTTHHVFTKDATQLEKKDIPAQLTAIITESYLGPPLSSIPSPENVKRNFQHIEELTLRFFAKIHSLAATNIPIIISFPAYKTKQKNFLIEELPGKIVKLGYKLETFNTKRGSLFYDRPDQIVAREIFKFIKI